MHFSSNNKVSLKGLTVWGICALFFTYEFLLRTVLGIFEQPVTYDLKLSPISFAMLSSTAYQAIYAFMQIPVALIIQRLGLKKSLFLAVSICVVSVALFSSTHSFFTAFFSRLLIGLGASFGFLALLIAVFEWFPTNKIALFIGLSQFLGTIGPMFAGGPLETLVTTYHISWRQLHLVLSVSGLCLLLPIYFFVDNNKEFIDNFRILKPYRGRFNTIKVLFRHKEAWLIALFSGCVYFSIEYFSENSGKAYLVLGGYDHNVATYLLSLSWLSYAISCPLLGYLSDRMGRRKPFMILPAILGGLSIVLIVFCYHWYWCTVLAFILLGHAASSQSIGFAFMAEQFNKQNISVGLGLNNAMIGIFTAVNAPIIGKLLLWLSHANYGRMVTYQMAFSILLLMMLFAFIIPTCLLNETYCKSKKDPYILKP